MELLGHVNASLVWRGKGRALNPLKTKKRSSSSEVQWGEHHYMGLLGSPDTHNLVHVWKKRTSASLDWRTNIWVLPELIMDSRVQVLKLQVVVHDPSSGTAFVLPISMEAHEGTDHFHLNCTSLLSSGIIGGDRANGPLGHVWNLWSPFPSIWLWWTPQTAYVAEDSEKNGL